MLCRYSGFTVYSRIIRRGAAPALQHHPRTLLTDAVEPPVDVTERPCTLILAEDGNYGVLDPAGKSSDRSWGQVFNQQFPVQYGIPVAQWSLSTSCSSFDDALREMKADLESSRIAQPIVVARGPWVSWLAQFYLESLPLAALILVDPLPFGESTEACQIYENLHRKNVSAQVMPTKYSLFQDYAQHGNHWTLQLEPAAVPTMVLSTIPAWLELASATAARHSDDSTTATTAVPVESVCDDQDAVSTIGKWILNEDIL